ncbi:putative manganese transporter [Alteromonas sp. 5E99-2]|uniref:putative manganese transporter n=1 Tax=Alteromonas sp. 5E99-2 TaxID=2817683 RepID=UPI001A995068|nr:putative manganese transporter [Alteromonas sp. 5E99-2]MBO1255678.1 putative manganese transporter [Alteromonas sp. 5E99-2]
MLLPAFLVVLCFQPNTQKIVLSVLSDAFLQVSAFVAATLALYYLITHYVESRISVHVITNNSWFELIGSAFLGALPGCGGAIVVITQFTRGSLRFGSVVAVLTSTMGDAAFLLLAQKPFDGLVVMALGFSVGVVSGGITNCIHQENFMRPATKIDTSTPNRIYSTPSKLQTQASLVSYQFWRVALFPTLIIALLISFQVDPNSLFGFELGTVEKAGAIACFFIVFLWSISSIGSSYQEVTSEENLNVKSNWVMKAALDTQFVTSWVVTAFLTFELVITWTGFDLAASFQSLGPLAILLAIAVGLLPGCGPQILITTLYLQNTIPFSAQIGNAISNDGDALFPAIALAPKAAIVATFYSTIPALIAGYGYYLFFE